MKAALKLAAMCGVAFALSAGSAAAQSNSYEVWAIDQSNSFDKAFGGTLYVYDGKELERGHQAADATPEKIDLGGAGAAMCFAKTGVNPVRPHMLAVNASHTHAIVSFVASGHVLILDAASRSPVDCIRTSIGAGGARQVHFAIPSPDQTYIAVANQNGKLFERIDTDYATNTFVLNTSAGINLVTCTTPNGVACQAAGNVSDDPTPDLLATSPNGSHVFMSLRGPNPLTADPHVSTGSTPGVGVIKVLANGKGGLFEALAPITNVDAGGVERADMHALTIRLK